MPRRKVLRKQRLSIHQLDIAEILELEVGMSEDDIKRRYGSDAILRERWRACRTEMLPKQGDADNEDRVRPGTRPWAWWRFEAKETVPKTPAEQLKRLRQLKELAAWESAAFHTIRMAAQTSH